MKALRDSVSDLRSTFEKATAHAQTFFAKISTTLKADIETGFEHLHKETQNYINQSRVAKGRLRSCGATRFASDES